MYIGIAFNNTICTGWIANHEIHTAFYKSVSNDFVYNHFGLLV